MVVALLALIAPANVIASTPAPLPNTITASPAAFNDNTGQTNIYYNLNNNNGSTTIDILGSNGVHIKTTDVSKQTGFQSQTWDGTDDKGNKVPEGTYSATLTVTTDKTTSSCNIVVDNTPPVTTYSLSKSKKPDSSYPMGVKLTLEATDSGSGISGISYKINSEEWQSYGTPVAFNSAGTYTVAYRSVDNANNTDTANGNDHILQFTITGSATASPTPLSTPSSMPTAMPCATPNATQTIEPCATPDATMTTMETPLPTQRDVTATPSTDATNGDQSQSYQATPSATLANGKKPVNRTLNTGIISVITIVSAVVLMFLRRR